MLKKYYKSIRFDLFLMSNISSFISITLICSFLLFYGIWQAKNGLVKELTIASNMLITRSAPALYWDDNQLLKPDLENFAAKDSILSICIYDKKKALFATFRKRIENQCENFQKEGFVFSSDKLLKINKLIYFQGSYVGTINIVSDLREVDAQVRFYLMISIGIFIFCILTSFLISIFFQKKIANPVIALSNFAKKITEQHNYTLRANIKASSEIEYLVKIFNEMLSKIETRDIELRNINAILEEKVKERTQELEESAIELQKALDSKVNIVKNMSHEIRTPSHQMAIFTEIIDSNFKKFLAKLKEHNEDGASLLENQDVKNLSGEITDNILKIRLSSNRYARIIKNVIDFNKLADKEMLFNIIECDIVDIVAKSVKQQQEQKHRIEFIRPEAEFMALADEKRIFLVMEHIFNNAGQFAPEGVVSVTISNKSYILNQKEFHGVQISVSDQGKGIPEDELEIIFELFAESRFTKSQAGGRGLGLAVCREIIIAHNGLIWAANNKDKGACFSFILPIAEKRLKEV